MRRTDRSPGWIRRLLLAAALTLPALVVGNSGTPLSAAPRPFTIHHVGEGMGVSSVSGDDRFVSTFEQSKDRWVRRSIQNGTAAEVGGNGQLDVDGSTLWRAVSPDGLVRETRRGRIDDARPSVVLPGRVAGGLRRQRQHRRGRRLRHQRRTRSGRGTL